MSDFFFGKPVVYLFFEKSFSTLGPPSLDPNHVAKLYPNVRGCGYPPQLQCPGNILF